MAPIWNPGAQHIRRRLRIQTDTAKSHMVCQPSAISDSDCKFLDVFLGHTGKTQAFRRSFIFGDLFLLCEANKYHVLSDADYYLRKYVLTSFRNYGSLKKSRIT